MDAESQVFFDEFIAGLKKRNPGEHEFHQAVSEVAAHIVPFIAHNPRYQNRLLLERLTEPDRIITFRVCWMDDEGNIRADRGYRVQNSNAIGPYKGGLRFHSGVNQSILKFLAFEQTFKNSLTGLPMGGAKGGSNFNPKGKSDAEIMRFCQSFITELCHYIGPDTDIPAGDIGVGLREIGYMFGQEKRLTNKFRGSFTGKGVEYGGSLIRTEATGYGTIYMLQNMLQHQGMDVEGMKIIISGAGNVAIHAAEKAMQLGAKVLTLSDSSGFIHDPAGLSPDKLEYIKLLKFKQRARISDYTNEYEASFHADMKPWSVSADVAIPCATENEITLADARILIANGCKAVVEGANMPTAQAAIEAFQNNRVLFAPGKAANAGGVAVSGLEMSQNSARISWSEEEIHDHLKRIMANIHDNCLQHGMEKDHINYAKGANIGGFIKVADAMLAYGLL